MTNLLGIHSYHIPVERKGFVTTHYVVHALRLSPDRVSHLLQTSRLWEASCRSAYRLEGSLSSITTHTDNDRCVILLSPVHTQGVDINFCPSTSGDPKDCDPIVAANLYCQRSGYDRATYFLGPIPANSTVAMRLTVAGKPRPVWNTTEGVMERCEAKGGKTCSAFRMVYCIREKMFVNPTVDGKPLDWCAITKDGKKECGKEAASAFCVRNGFSHGAWAWNGPAATETTYAEGYPKPYKVDTVSLDASDSKSPGKVCNSKQEECKTFSSINCEL